MLLEHAKFMISKKVMWSKILKKIFIIFGINVLIFFIFKSLNDYMFNVNAAIDEIHSLNLALYFLATIIIILLGYVKVKEVIKSQRISYFKILGFSKKEILIVALMPLIINSVFFLLCSIAINFYLRFPMINSSITFVNIFCIQFILIFLRANVKRFIINIFKVLISSLYIYTFFTVDYSYINYDNKETNFLSIISFVATLLSCIGKSPVINFFIDSSNTLCFNKLLCLLNVIFCLVLIFNKSCYSIVEAEHYQSFTRKNISVLGKLKKYLLQQNKYTAQLVKDLCYYKKTISFIILCFVNTIIGILSIKVSPFNYAFFTVLIFFISWMNPTVILDLYNLDMKSKLMYKLWGLKSIELMKLKIFNGVIISFLPIFLILSINLIFNNISIIFYLLILILSLLYVILETVIYSFAINLYVPSWDEIMCLQPIVLLNLIPIFIPITLVFFLFKLRKRSKKYDKGR